MPNHYPQCYPPKEDAQDSDLSQSEKNSEIKPPLVQLYQKSSINIIRKEAKLITKSLQMPNCFALETKPDVVTPDTMV